MTSVSSKTKNTGNTLQVGEEEVKPREGWRVYNWKGPETVEY